MSRAEDILKQVTEPSDQDIAETHHLNLELVSVHKMYANIKELCGESVAESFLNLVLYTTLPDNTYKPTLITYLQGRGDIVSRACLKKLGSE